MHKITYTLIWMMLVCALLIPVPSRAQEELAAPSASNEPELWTLHAGIGSPKAWNFMGITREYLLDDHTAFYITGGLGTALIGAGITYYDNREGNGVVATSAIGIVDLQATLAYQFKIGKQDFISVGGSYGMFFMQCWCWLPLLSYEHRY